MMKNQKFIGMSKTCKINCEASKREAYKQGPHSGDHQILSEKQFNKRLNTTKISMIDSLISDNIQLINAMIEQGIQNIKKLGNQAIADLKRSLLISMMNQKVQVTQRLENTFFKLTKLEYQQLTCEQLNQIFTSINKNCKSSALENSAEQHLKKLEKKLKQISMPSFIKQSKINKSSILDKSSTQSSQQSEKEKEMDSIDNYFASHQSTQNDISIDFQDSEKDEKLFPLDQSMVTIINKLNEPLFKKKESLPNQSFFIEKNSQKKEKKQPALKDFSSDQQQKAEKPALKKSSESFSKKQKEEELSIDMSMQMQEKDPTKSFINKDEGRYYITVSHLQKQVQKKEKTKFNIELRVVQKIMYRLFKDKKSERMYRKVKFVAGDANGIVVCYTNNMVQLKKDCYVVLKDCTFDEFKEKSYEICSNHCEIIKEKRTFEVKISNSISRFSCMSPLIYSLQKEQSKWPSVLGIAYLDRVKCKSIQLIVKVDEIIEQLQDRIRCYLSDGTAQIYAIIDTVALPKELVENKNMIGLVGSVFFVKKLQAHEGKLGEQDIIYLTIGKENNPVLMKDMQYNDNIVVKNVNQIVKELKS